MPFAVTFLIGILAVNAFQVSFLLNNNQKSVKPSITSTYSDIYQQEISDVCQRKVSEIRDMHCTPCGCWTVSNGFLKGYGIYTTKARKNNVEGTVSLKVTFLSTGKIGTVSVVKGLPDGLTEQSVKLAKGIEFQPRRVNNLPETETVQVDYIFKLH